MVWYIGQTLSLVFLITTVLAISFGTFKNRKKRNFPILRTVMIGVFCSSVGLFLPIYWNRCSQEDFRFLKSCLMAVHNTIRLFVLDGDFEIIFESTEMLDYQLVNAYQMIASILYLIAPLLTFSFVLTLFKQFCAKAKLYFSYFQNIYAFSELNIASITLAENIRANHKKCVLLFTDVYDQKVECTQELLDRAAKIKAVVLPSDITHIRFDRHSPKAHIKVFLLGESDDENVMQYRTLLEKYRQNERMSLYLFSMSAQSELAIAGSTNYKLKVYRIDEADSLIYNYLYENGGELFHSAYAMKNGKKVISVVIVGLGRYGKTFLKTLAWFGQMDGYYLKIHAFDMDPLAESELRAECPELLDERYNGVDVEGEAQYEIHVHSDVRAGTQIFVEQIREIKDVSFAVTCLGKDENNIKCALSLRTMFERMNIKPIIKAVVHQVKDATFAVTDPEEKEDSAKRSIFWQKIRGKIKNRNEKAEDQDQSMVDGSKELKNFAGQPYRIDFIGYLRTMYSEKVLIQSELKKDALERHMKYGKESAFWQHEYNYRSSCASALHYKAKLACNIPGADKSEEEVSEEEKRLLSEIEHKRWNAYMRSIGYIYSGSPRKSSRNDLGKMHHNLVCFEELSADDIKKDFYTLKSNDPQGKRGVSRK